MPGARMLVVDLEGASGATNEGALISKFGIPPESDLADPQTPSAAFLSPGNKGKRKIFGAAASQDHHSGELGGEAPRRN